MKEELFTGQFRITCAIALGLFLNYQSLSVLAPYFVATRGASSIAVGSVTAIYMIAATISSVAVGALPVTADFRWPLAASLALLCLPGFAFPFLTTVPEFLVASAIRGLGFGAAGVLVGTLAATIAPSARRGLALGIVGMITSGCAIVGQSGTLLLAGRFGFAPAFLGVAALSLVTAAVIAPLRRIVLAWSGPKQRPAGFEARRLIGPGLALFLTCMVYGAVTSFAALHLRTAPQGTAALYFLVLASCIPSARLIAGGLVDLVGYLRLFLVSVVAGAAGMWALGALASVPLSVAAAALFGTGFGALTSTTQLELTHRVAVARFVVVNGIFSSAWNAGMGAGGVICGLLAVDMGYGAMFKLTSLFLVAAGLTAVLDSVLTRGRMDERTGTSPTLVENYGSRMMSRR